MSTASWYTFFVLKKRNRFAIEVAMLVREGMSQTLLNLIPGNSDAFRAIICEMGVQVATLIQLARPHCGVFMYTDKVDTKKLRCPFEKALSSQHASAIVHTPLPVMLPYSVVILIYELSALGVMIQIKPSSGPKGEPEVVPLPLKI